MPRWIALLALIAACSNEEAMLHADFAGAAQDDAEWMLRFLLELDVAAAALPAQDATDRACGESWPACSICSDLEGSNAAGSFAAGPESPPCAASGAGAVLSATYTIHSSALSGTWVGEPDAYDWLVEGERDSTLTIDSPARGERTWDASWGIDSFSVRTDRGNLDDFDLAWSYPDFGGERWTIDVSGTRSSLDGSAAGDGVTCTVAGSPESVDVECP